MRAMDVMTQDVVTVDPHTPVRKIAQTLIGRGISAVPVVDGGGALLGIISERDLLRRVELGTGKHRRRFAELFVDVGKLADEYTQSHAQRAGELMTSPVITVAPQTALSEVVDIFERHGINRVPVVENGALVGIVTRGNLVRALAAMAPEKPIEGLDDHRIKDLLMAEFERHAWGRRRDEDVVVRDGVVHFWGVVGSDSERQALRLAARNTPGVIDIRDHTVFAPFAPGMP